MANQGYWEKSRTHQFVALVLRLLRPSNLVATNPAQAGYVPSVGADDQFTWVPAGGGGGGATVAYIEKDFQFITGGEEFYFTVPQDITLTSVTLLSDVAGSVDIDIWAIPYAGYNMPTDPNAGDSICGANPPVLVGSNKYQDSTLAGWTVALPASTTLVFKIGTVTTLFAVNLTLACVASASTGGVASVTGDDGISVDNLDPFNPVVSARLSTDVDNTAVFGTDGGLFVPAGGGSSEFGFEVAFDGGGAILTTGALTAGAATMPQAGTIDTVTVTATPGTTATVSVAVYRSTYAAYPAGTLIHTATLTAAQKTQTTGLSIAITAGDQIWGEVLSNTDCVGITVAGTGT